MNDMRGASARRPRRATTPRARATLIGSVVALAMAAVLGTVGASAPVAGAASNKGVLFTNSLAKPSAAVQPASAPGVTGAFVDGKYRLTTTTDALALYAPIFTATGPQLSSIRVDADMSLASKKAFGGLDCRSGSDAVTRYAFLVTGTGDWVLGKTSGSENNALKQGRVKTPANKQAFHLTFVCTGEEQPGTTGSVTLKFLIDGKQVVSFTDSTSALPVALPAAVGMEADVGSASFSNMVVKQT
jgi:hypothetical protein